MRALRAHRRDRDRFGLELLIENAAREFVKDLSAMMEKRQDDIFHVLPTEVYLAHRDEIQDLVANCVCKRVDQIAGQVRFGKRLLRSARPHLQAALALRTHWSKAQLHPHARPNTAVHSFFFDFAHQMVRICEKGEAFHWMRFARELCEETDDLVRTYSMSIKTFKG